MPALMCTWIGRLVCADEPRSGRVKHVTSPLLFVFVSLADWGRVSGLVGQRRRNNGSPTSAFHVESKSFVLDRGLLRP